MGRSSNYSNQIYQQLQEIMGRLDSVEQDLKKEKREHKEDVERLEKLIIEKDKKIEVLTEDNERLKRILNNNSSNSSLPPSTDKKTAPANTYNTRTKSGKKAGGQIGHQGITLTKKEVQEKLSSGKFQHRIETIGVESDTYITKYVLDLEIVPTIREIRIYATEDGRILLPKEYQSEVTYGSTIKALAVDLYSEGVMSNERISHFLNALSGNELSLSAGSIYHFCRTFQEKSRQSLQQIETELLNETTICTDATVVTVNGTQAYIRNSSSPTAVLYHAMEQKSIEALNKIPFLNKFAGNLEHDHETALYHYGTGHGECNVHALRYLKKNTEETGHRWSEKMSSLLCEMNERRKEYQRKSIYFTKEEIKTYEERYEELIQKGREENKETKGRIAKEEETKLLNRLEKYQENHLLFLRDCSVPFENNLSERDLRKCKNRQKMSGGFRKQSGNEMYCSIMSIIETCKRKQMHVIEQIQKIFEGTPAIF